MERKGCASSSMAAVAERPGKEQAAYAAEVSPLYQDELTIIEEDPIRSNGSHSIKVDDVPPVRLDELA